MNGKSVMIVMIALGMAPAGVFHQGNISAVAHVALFEIFCSVKVDQFRTVTFAKTKHFVAVLTNATTKNVPWSFYCTYQGSSPSAPKKGHLTRCHQIKYILQLFSSTFRSCGCGIALNSVFICPGSMSITGMPNNSRARQAKGSRLILKLDCTNAFLT